ncbi:MAG: right-handed parallel beta-helix repeat-containing protein [Deltaproteobacteria bacterium]|nr:right-handed parallel beta-helix repeat-containing protein [Deltaproteobacteria bacterium]
MNYGFSRKHKCVFFVVSIAMVLLFSSTGSPSTTINVNLTAPTNRSTVSGSITIACAVTTQVVWVNFYIDGTYLASSPPYILNWDSRTVSNGTHTISATAFGRNSAILGTSSVSLNVANIVEVTFNRPHSATTVSGVTPVTATAARNVAWLNFYVDGSYQASTPRSWSAGAPATWYWNASPYSLGNHTVSASAYSSSSTLLGNASVTVSVASPTPVPRMSVATSGTPTNPVIYDGHGAMSKGFDVSGSYVVIQNWNISTQAIGTNAYGVFVHNGAHNVTIQNNSIHDLCNEGVAMDATVSYITVASNTIYRASMSGIHADGKYANVQGNDVSLTMQYPDRLGGIFSVCQELNGADADAIRFFGLGHVIAHNELHDVPFGGWGSAASPDPHTDCFQTWGASGETTDNILIEYNDCRASSPAATSGIEISSLAGLDGPVGTITYKYNTFANMKQGINIESNVGAVVFDHNSVAHILEEILIFGEPTTSASAITNNIFYDTGGGGDSYTTSLGPTISNNDCILATGNPCGRYPLTAPAVSLNPQFASLGSGSDPWLSLDFHLLSTSAVATMGAFPLQ